MDCSGDLKVVRSEKSTGDSPTQSRNYLLRFRYELNSPGCLRNQPRKLSASTPSSTATSFQAGSHSLPLPNQAFLPSWPDLRPSVFWQKWSKTKSPRADFDGTGRVWFAASPSESSPESWCYRYQSCPSRNNRACLTLGATEVTLGAAQVRTWCYRSPALVLCK